MHAEVTGAELLDGTEGGGYAAVLGANRCALTVNSLGTGHEHLANRQVAIADDLEHLRGAEAVDEDVFRHFRHVAAVCSFVEDDINVG